MPLNPSVPTLAELLRARGYRTAAFIANSTYVSKLFGFDRGKDRRLGVNDGLTVRYH